MADEIDDDPWLEQLRAALAEAGDGHDELARSSAGNDRADIDWTSIEPAEESALPEPSAPFDAPTPLPSVDEHPVAESPAVDPTPPDVAPPPATATAASEADTSLILDSLAQVTRTLTQLTERVDAFEEIERGGPSPFDQVELDVVVADAVRASLTRAQATGAGTTRLETEVRVLEETVSKLSKRVADLNVTALARDRLEKDVHVERLADAAEAVQGQLAAASEARKSFEAGVEKMLQHAKEGDGEDVAWTDVMLLAHELRSRVDDLDDQQRRAMRDLSDWQTSVDDRLSSLRAELVREVRALRDPEA